MARGYGYGKFYKPQIFSPWSVKKMEINEKETLLYCRYDDLELEMYQLNETDEEAGSVWIKISKTINDGKQESLEFPVEPDNINHLVAAVKKARMIIKDQWTKEQEEQEEDEDESASSWDQSVRDLLGTRKK